MSDQNNRQERNRLNVPSRHIPVRPNLDQLKRQTKELLRDIRRGDPAAIDEFKKYHLKGPVNPVGTPALPVDVLNEIRLADAQLDLARSYGVRSWPGWSKLAS